MRLGPVRRRRSDERGVVLPSAVALLSAAAVAAACVAYVATASGDPQDEVTPAAATRSGSPAAEPPSRSARPRTPDRTSTPKPKPKPKPEPVVSRGETFVEVYNNSGISGLAGTTAARARGAGWQVVGEDNWYGMVPASTVYYPPRLREAAVLLGRDLGISRQVPSIAPMRLDRLTVILTTDYVG